MVQSTAETDGYSASNFIDKVTEYLQDNDQIDYAILNNGPFSELALRMYESEHKFPVQADVEACAKRVRHKVLTGAFCKGKAILRHDSQILARYILDIE